MLKKRKKKVSTKKITRPSILKKPINTSSSKSSDLPAWLMMLYGTVGIGKTSFASHFTDPGFIITKRERGIKTLTGYGITQAPKQLWVVESWPEVLETIDNVCKSKIQTLVIDSITVLEHLCFDYHCKEYFDDDWTKTGWGNYQAGPRNAKEKEWPTFMALLQEVVESNINVLILAHAMKTKVQDPLTAEYDQWQPQLNRYTWEAIHTELEAILFYREHLEVEVTTARDKKNKVKRDSGDRYIYTDKDPAYIAKNWFGLPAAIDAGESAEEAHTNFMKAMRGCYKHE